MRFWAFLAFLGGCYALQSNRWGRTPSNSGVPRPRESQSQIDPRVRSLAAQREPEQNWCLWDNQRRTNLQQVLTNAWDRNTPVYDSQAPGTRPTPIGQAMPGFRPYRGPGVPRVLGVSAPAAPAPVARQPSWTGPMVPRFQGVSSYGQDRRGYSQPPPTQYAPPPFNPFVSLPSDEIFERLSRIQGLRTVPAGEINVRTEVFPWSGIYVMRTVEIEPSIPSLMVVLTRVSERFSRIQGPPLLLNHDVEFDVATGRLYRTQLWTSRTSLRDYVGYDPPTPIRELPYAYQGFLTVMERLPQSSTDARITSPPRGGNVPSYNSGIMIGGRPRARGDYLPPRPLSPPPPPPKPKRIVPTYPDDTPAKDDDSDDTCSICYVNVQNTRYKPCKHQFCFSCTKEIIKTSPFRCPTCRCVIDDYGKLPSDSDAD